MHLDRAPLGSTSLRVSRLGLGASRLGDLEPREAFALLDAAVTFGVNVIDTARSYGASEARIGAWLSARPDVDVVLSTKVGYGVEGVEDWTGEAITRGIDLALRRLAVEQIHVVHLHSCPAHVALRDDVQRALLGARAAGKLVALGYSGENEDLDGALSCSTFDVAQLSVSLVDQGSRELRLPSMRSRNIGVLAKRVLGNAPWMPVAHAPSSPEAEYARRFDALRLSEPEEGWASFSLRFAAFSPGVHTALLGVRSPSKLESAARAMARGPLLDDMVSVVEGRWRQAAAGWRGVV